MALQDLNQMFSIVKPDGTPTDYFMRLLRDRKDSSLTLEEQVGVLSTQVIGKADKTTTITAGIGLDGGGDLSANRTIDLNAPIDLLSDVDVTTTPPTAGQALIWDAVNSLWIPGSVASGGGGGGSSILDEIMHARGTAFDAAYTNGDKVDKLVSSGDMRALVFDLYTDSGTPITATTATVTVPIGKIAILLYYETQNHTRNDPSYYRHCLRNVTAGTQINATDNPISYAGWVSPDSANTSIQFPVVAGVAGDVLSLQAWSAGDGNYRTVSGSCVIALADATTGAWSLPSSGGGGFSPTAMVQFTVDQSTFAVTINKQTNVSSVTRTGTGMYRISFNTALADDQYSVQCNGRYADYPNNDNPKIGPNRHTGTGNDQYSTTTLDIVNDAGYDVYRCSVLVYDAG